MGEEAPEYLLGKSGDVLESQGYQTLTIIGDKTYAVGEPQDISKLSITVKVFDSLTGNLLEPVVFGTKPAPCKRHTAILVDNNRILILLSEASPDNSIWFLEVDTASIKQKKKLLGTEVVAWSKGFLGYGSKPVVICGPSGVGKGTLIEKLMKEFPSTFGFSVSHTTRAPREKEVSGVHYHFTERRKMEEDIQDGKFLEYALVHGNLYGTSIEAVEAVSDAGKTCILDIDVQGARLVRASSLEAMFTFVCPPSFEELEARLRARGTESEEQIQKRLRNARSELEQGNSPGLFDHILINDELESCYQNLKKLLALEENNSVPSHPFIKDFILPVSCNISKVNHKIIIQRQTDETVASPSSMFVLDVSLLEGGAPARTRGLKIYAAKS